MVSFDYESALYDPIASYVRRKSFRWQRPEVQFYEYRIDLLAFSQTLSLTVAIELKLTRWRRAFEQAVLYQLCADHVFVALPEKTIDRVDIDLFQSCGIGLLAVKASGRCREIIEPQQSSVIRSNYRSTYIEMLQGGHNA